jgi:ankyrin repeat protein
MDKFTAVKEGDLQQLRVALTVDNVNDVDDRGKTVLHWAAAAYERFDCVKHCIEMGANVNARTLTGHTPLHFASFYSVMEGVRILLDVGAIVDTTTNDGYTPLYYAIRYEYVGFTKLVLDRGAKVSNVTLDNFVPAIPDWITTFIESRSNCRIASITIIGIHKYRRTNVTGNNDINVLRLVSKHIWSTRMDDVWVTPPIEAFK